MHHLNRYQVVVVGGGPGGIMAALAAARRNVKTLLVERAGFLGGSATLSKIGPISPLHYNDEQVVYGLPCEFISELVNANGATGYMKCLNPFGTGSYVCIYNHEIYKYVAQKMLIEAGVDILFHTTVSTVIKQGNRIVALQLTGKFDSYVVEADITVDATGDGDIAVLAGEEFDFGDCQGHVQPSSAMFEMANVDTEKLYNYIKTNKQDFGRLSDLVPMEDTPFQKQHYFVAQGFQSLVNQAVAEGSLVFGRENIHITTGLYPGVIHFNSARISNYNTVSSFERSKSELDGRQQIDSIARFMIRRVPGFENAYLSATCCEVGVRESRHIHGINRLTGENILNADRFPDVIARGLFAVDIHGNCQTGNDVAGSGGFWKDLKDAYDIPYGITVPAHIDGLLLAGRCVSADHVAFSSLRVQGTLMGYSQAVGFAAALCAEQHIQPRSLDVAMLQHLLIQTGASPYRNPQKKHIQEQKAIQKVKEYLAEHDELITPEKYLAPYRV